ncbi:MULTISPECIES: flagellar FliJ family protein [Helicobacter]|uniref:flagellar FliJ family protein n=1 Tax=Helicobacter TaxID=209 RepID=UPI000EB12C8D|nr:MULTISPECIES: flagellar FliJ family protein [Helicobacter]
MTPFDALLKIKRQLLQRAQIALANNHAQIARTQQEISALRAELEQLGVGAQGSMDAFLQLNALKHNYRYALAQLHTQVDRLQEDQARLQEQHRQANLECEKIAYLQTLQTQARLARLQRLEHKEMDAISTGMFAYKQRSSHA